MADCHASKVPWSTHNVDSKFVHGAIGNINSGFLPTLDLSTMLAYTKPSPSSILRRHVVAIDHANGSEFIS